MSKRTSRTALLDEQSSSLYKLFMAKSYNINSNFIVQVRNIIAWHQATPIYMQPQFRFIMYKCA